MHSALSSPAFGCLAQGDTSSVAQRRLIVVFGQSNSFGQEWTGNIGTTQRKNVGTSYSNVNMRQKTAQATAPDPIAWTTDQATTLQSYTSSSDNRSGHGIDGQGLGPAQSFGRHLDYYKPNHFDIAVFGVSGTSLQSNWGVNVSYPASGPNLYQQFLTFVSDTANALKSRLVAVVWVQGESDSTDSTAANNYATNLQALFNDFRTHYPTCPIIFNKLPAGDVGTFTSTVRAAQDTVAGQTSNCTLVNVDDVSLSGDATHFTADGYCALGDVLGKAVVGVLGYTNPKSWTIDNRLLVGLPQSASEWNSLLAAAGVASGGPSILYLLQEGSGNIIDAIGGHTGTASGTNLTYQVANQMLDTKGIQISGGTGQFANTDAGLPDPSTTSWARICVAYMQSAATTRNCWLMGTAGFAAISMINGGWRMSDGGNTTNGAANPQNSVRIFIQKRDKTNAISAAYNDHEKISGTQGTVTGKKETVFTNSGNGTFAYFYVADFFGAAAEKTDTEWRNIVNAMGWWNPSAADTSAPW